MRNGIVVSDNGSQKLRTSGDTSFRDVPSPHLANAVEAAGLRQTGVAFPVAFEHAVAADPIADVPLGVVFWEAKIWTAGSVGFFEAFALAGSVSRHTSAFAFIPVLHLLFRATFLPTFEGVGLEAGAVAFLIRWVVLKC